MRQPKLLDQCLGDWLHHWHRTFGYTLSARQLPTTIGQLTIGTICQIWIWITILHFGLASAARKGTSLVFHIRFAQVVVGILLDQLPKEDQQRQR